MSQLSELSEYPNINAMKYGRDETGWAQLLNLIHITNDHGGQIRATR